MLPDTNVVNTSRTMCPRTRRHRAAAECGISALIAPFEVEPHVERPIVQVGQRRIFVAHEPAKCAAAEPQQLEAAHARDGLNDPAAVDLETSRCGLATRGLERHVSTDSRVRNLRRRQLQPFDLRILRKKHLADEAAILFHIVAAEIHRLALHKIFHRIGGDEAAVIPLGVGLPECIAVDEQQHVHTKHRVAVLRRVALPLETVGNDVPLAVVVTLRS